MFIANNLTFRLNHRSSFFRGKNDCLAAVSKTGEISLVNLANNKVETLNLASQIERISFLGIENHLALIDKNGSFSVQNLQGDVIFQDSSQNFVDVFSDQKADAFWLTARINSEEIEVQLRQTADFMLVDKIKVEDELVDSIIAISSTPIENLYFLFLAAGQDGLINFGLQKINNAIKCWEETTLSNASPPIFSPNGKRFLAIDNDELIFNQFSYPNLEKEFAYNLELEDDCGGYSSCFLDNQIALISSQAGRIFAVNTELKKLLGEVLIENHEPHSTSFYYPRLSDDDSLCTDISSFEQFGENVVFVYRQEENPWKDSLIFIPKKKILEAISAKSDI